MEGDLWVSASPPAGKIIDTALLITPLLEEIPMTERDESDDSLDADYHFDISHVETLFPNGIYSLALQYTDGTRGACFSSLAGNS